MRLETLAALGCLLILPGCIKPADDASIQAAIDTFYDRLGRHEYGAIYDATAPEFQASASKPLFLGMMARVDRKMGACQPPVKMPAFGQNVTTGGTFKWQGYTRQCANGVLEDRVTVALRGDQAAIIGFNTNNPILMTD